MKKIMQSPVIWLLLLGVIFMMALQLRPMNESKPLEITYNSFLQAVREGKLDVINVTVTEVVGLYKGSAIPRTSFPRRYDFKIEAPASIEAFHKDILDAEALGQGKEVGATTASDYRFELEYKPVPETPWWLTWLPLLLPTAAIIVLWYFMFRQQSGGGKVMSFGKSRARMHFEDRNKVTFENLAGMDEEKTELKEIVEFLKSPKRFLDLGARIPKGVLLVGPPGTGKTQLAKAVAGEASVPFFSISGSDFVEMFVGVGASRVRDLFEQAKKNAPSIIFIDEIDAVGRHRGAGLGGGHDEREQTLNQLLVEMDGFSANEGVIIIAATNRPDILDPALLRPGRFDRQVTVNYPDVKGREAILHVHAKGKPFAEDVDFNVIARRTVGFTGADLENVLNEAAILTGRAHGKSITMKEIEEAITRVMMGPEKRSHIPSEKDKRITAYHEAGHAILAYLLPNAAKVHMVSIIPRGRTGGHTQMLRDEDSDYMTSAQLTEQIVVAMGGDVAEKLVLGISTTGSSEDLKHATSIARRMITSFGMSEALGHVYLATEQEVFIGRDYGHAQNYSEQVAASIDAEIRRLLEECYKRAEDIMSAHLERMHSIVEALLDRENITKEEFDELMTTELAPAV